MCCRARKLSVNQQLHEVRLWEFLDPGFLFLFRQYLGYFALLLIIFFIILLSLNLQLQGNDRKANYMAVVAFYNEKYPSQ